MTGQNLEPWARSPVPRFQHSTPVAAGMDPNDKACSSPGASQGSWTKTDGRTHSFHSPHAPRCRRSDAGGSPGHSWLNTGGEDKSQVWNNNGIPDRKQESFLSFPHHWKWRWWFTLMVFLKVKYCLFRANILYPSSAKTPLKWHTTFYVSHLSPLPCDPDELTRVDVTAL